MIAAAKSQDRIDKSWEEATADMEELKELGVPLSLLKSMFTIGYLNGENSALLNRLEVAHAD